MTQSVALSFLFYAIKFSDETRSSFFRGWTTRPQHTSMNQYRTFVYRLVTGILISKALRMARVNEESHSVTCHPHRHTLIHKWNESSCLWSPAAAHRRTLSSSSSLLLLLLLLLRLFITRKIPEGRKCAVLISRPTEGRKLSWPGSWLYIWVIHVVCLPKDSHQYPSTNRPIVRRP